MSETTYYRVPDNELRAWRTVAESHVGDAGIAGTLARALATVLDEDAFVILFAVTES